MRDEGRRLGHFQVEADTRARRYHGEIGCARDVEGHCHGGHVVGNGAVRDGDFICGPVHGYDDPGRGIVYGATLTGTGGPTEDHQMPIQNGKVDGKKVTFEIALDQGRVMSFSLTAEEDRLSGDVSGGDKSTGETKSGTLSVKRVSDK